MNKIVERIERELSMPGLAAILAQRLTPTDLQSLLLEVYRLRLGRMQPAQVLSNYQTNRFVPPARISPLKLLKWEQVAFEHLPAEFQALELSPVCPLGTNSAVAPVDPGWSVATIRNSEVVSDSTNVLALECALRRERAFAGRHEIKRSRPSGSQPPAATSTKLPEPQTARSLQHHRTVQRRAGPG